MHEETFSVRAAEAVRATVGYTVYDFSTKITYMTETGLLVLLLSQNRAFFVPLRDPLTTVELGVKEPSELGDWQQQAVYQEALDQVFSTYLCNQAVCRNVIMLPLSKGVLIVVTSEQGTRAFLRSAWETSEIRYTGGA